MAPVKVRWTDNAVADLEHARDYIAASNPSEALHVIGRIESALKALRAYPELGRIGRVERTRELVVPDTPFIIAYRTSLRSIEILAVIHGHRRWPANF
ncbi:MAG: type II toxin-antitoxin system RelE/ParE family toxin [Deltaproteobacteria bacterium]